MTKEEDDGVSLQDAFKAFMRAKAQKKVCKGWPTGIELVFSGEKLVLGLSMAMAVPSSLLDSCQSFVAEASWQRPSCAGPATQQPPAQGVPQAAVCRHSAQTHR